MKALGISQTKAEAKALMQEIDKDGNGEVDFEEFKNLMWDKLSQRNPEEELKKAFRFYDSDDSGKIDFENLKKVA